MRQSDGYHYEVRFGIIANNENDCITCDSSIGFGYSGLQRKYDNKIYPAQGYILGKVCSSLFLIRDPGGNTSLFCDGGGQTQHILRKPNNVL